MAEQLVSAAEVETLRVFWVDAIENARRGTEKARQDAESLAPDNARRHDLMAYIDAIKLEVELRRAAYEDAARRFEIQEARAHDAASNRLATTNTKLAKSQTLIAGAVALFTLVQVALAIAQAMKWINQ